jgi:hypothetical protein
MDNAAKAGVFVKADTSSAHPFDPSADAVHVVDHGVGEFKQHGRQILKAMEFYPQFAGAELDGLGQAF